MKREAAERRGRAAETLACWYLRLTGWRILDRRARVPGGEVDIIARRGRVLAFIEVKARNSAQAADWSLDRNRLRRVARAAEILSARHARPGDDIRVDAILIAPRRMPRRLANVWQG